MLHTLQCQIRLPWCPRWEFRLPSWAMTPSGSLGQTTPCPRTRRSRTRGSTPSAGKPTSLPTPSTRYWVPQELPSPGRGKAQLWEHCWAPWRSGIPPAPLPGGRCSWGNAARMSPGSLEEQDFSGSGGGSSFVSPVGRSWSWGVVGVDVRVASGKEQKFPELFCSVDTVTVWSFPLPWSLRVGGCGLPSGKSLKHYKGFVTGAPHWTVQGKQLYPQGLKFPLQPFQFVQSW